MPNAEQQRLADLVRERLLGATLIDSECIERDPDAKEFTTVDDDHRGLSTPSAGEVAYVLLWMRPTGHAAPHHTEWGTHRAVLSLASDDRMLVWGHYYYDLGAAVEDYEARAGLTLRGVGR